MRVRIIDLKEEEGGGGEQEKKKQRIDTNDVSRLFKKYITLIEKVICE